MKEHSIMIFVRDRFVFILVVLLIIGLYVGAILLSEYNPSVMDLGTVLYFVGLGLFFMLLGLAVDYIRQREFYKQVHDALERSGELHASVIVQTFVTREQRLVTLLFKEQHRAYLNKLHVYRRQQELHNHFVLQWVHHMKTPVSVIDMMAQDAQQELPLTQEAQRKILLSMKEEAERLTSGLEMMLYTARLEKFEMDLHLKTTPLHEVIRSVIHSHKRLCIRHSIFPKIEGEAWVETDEKWITVVFNQFISNSIKYRKKHVDASSLLFELKTAPNGGGKLSVIDEGIGIAAHDLPRIFDSFFTGENGCSTGESTGMGLFLAKQICKRLGHGLYVTSELGVGTTMTVTFEPRGIHKLTAKSS
ncbi:HAMP domain-containing sensor histidine kinase [Paenibacillus sp. YYML68]|uniref:sensor histidine kinase n=1 Tax=Paenibacillus sp. YYML68 TaxID=2909250 RepID=UPI002490C628|nr:sensor histidine kinase [Paenibacillus sp. YYML68]